MWFIFGVWMQNSLCMIARFLPYIRIRKSCGPGATYSGMWVHLEARQTTRAVQYTGRREVTETI